MAAVPSISVICVTYESSPVLRGFITSLAQGMAGTSWGLTIVDNASRDDSVALARALAPDANIVQASQNGGFAAGVNLGLEAVPPRNAVLLVNPDARLHEGCAAEMLRVLDEPTVGIVAPRLLEEDGETFPSLRREPTLTRLAGAAFLGERMAGRVPFLGEVIVGERNYSRPRDVAWAGGAVLLLSPTLFDRVAPMDESFFLYSEEADLALRARDSGFRVRYQPKACATHLA